MKIGINLLYLIPGLVGGTETYGVSLVKALSKIDQTNEYFIFVNKRGSQLNFRVAGNFHVIVSRFYGDSRLVRYAWEQFVLPWQLRFHKIDVVHSLGYVGCLISPCPSVVTIPDANFIALKNTLPLSKRIPLRFFSTQSARRAQQVITISHFSKAELVRTLQLPPEKISVTHLGPRSEAAAAEAPRWDLLKERYGIREPFIVAFGGGALHKNLSVLLKAFWKLRKDMPHQLVLIGHIPANVDLEEPAYKADLDDRIRATGYVPENHILPILSHADMFVLPSLYEGFGLPILEAQQAGVPVLSSCAASLPEVGGAGAIYFDPQSVASVMAALRRCLGETGLRATLVRAGKANLRRFSWEKTARATLRIYNTVHAAAAK